jgi:hypothetical protein
VYGLSSLPTQKSSAGDNVLPHAGLGMKFFDNIRFSERL